MIDEACSHIIDEASHMIAFLHMAFPISGMPSTAY